MATIVQTDGAIFGVQALVQTTLNGTLDTFAYRAGQGQILVLRNPTAGALSPVINGSSNTPVSSEGLGIVATASGYVVGSVAATTGIVMIPLDSIAQYLKGTISITSGVGLVATLIKSK